MTDAGSLAIWSSALGPKVKEAVTVDSQTPVVRHDNLEDIYAGTDSLVDTHKDYAEGTVVEEDDPLAEFEAWLTSGAVQIVDKL